MATAWYMFGNHFHWVDMQWLWGYRVLSESVRDQLRFTEVTGAPGNINFDGIGYEKMAAEDPGVVAELREAVADGRAEVVGATYGQPYALFHHGESAVRQLTFGVRAAHRVLGVRPRSFWEEEFFFFPQLPQMLVDAGYEYASLFFQWTWHTPHVPSEDAPAVWWRGVDGTRILTLPKGPLNLHQWPEDFAALVAHPLLSESPAPVVQQWLELYPSPDWMCRSELLTDGVRELFERADVEFRAGTMSTVLDAVREHAVERTYTMDDVYHGMSLGKNGDHGHRRSRRLEQDLLAAETLAVHAATAGRPYPHWDAYPGWELDEAWRELLAFQHHDNDECEGLCGHVGFAGLDRADAMVRHVLDRTLRAIAARAPGDGRRRVLCNPLGWARDVVVDGRRYHLPGFGAVPLTQEAGAPVTPASVIDDGATVTLSRGAFSAVVDRASGAVVRLGDVDLGAGLGRLRWERDETEEWFGAAEVVVEGDAVAVTRVAPSGDVLTVRFRLADEIDALDVHVEGVLTHSPDGRAHAALMTPVEPALDVVELRHDTPYAVGPVSAQGTYLRKYPTGEWMTSPQVFEEVRNPGTALQLLDLLDADGGGLLWLHDGSQGFHRTDAGVWQVLSMRDPWDEDYFRPEVDARFRAVPHRGLTDAARWKLAQEMTRPALVGEADGPPVGPPLAMPLLTVSGAPGVVATALYRDTDLAARTAPDHVNHRAPAAVLVRLVELDGVSADVALDVQGTVAGAWRVTTLGEVREELAVHDGVVRVPMRAHGIATVALDVVEARPVPRNLDEHREVWAQVHRVNENEDQDPPGDEPGREAEERQ